MLIHLDAMKKRTFHSWKCFYCNWCFLYNKGRSWI